MQHFCLHLSLHLSAPVCTSLQLVSTHGSGSADSQSAPMVVRWSLDGSVSSARVSALSALGLPLTIIPSVCHHAGPANAARCPVRASPTPVAESCSLPPSTQSLNFSSPSHGFFAKIRVEMSYRCRDVDYVKKPVRRRCGVEIWGSSQGRRVR
jgi:hypothetical protein